MATAWNRGVEHAVRTLARGMFPPGWKIRVWTDAVSIEQATAVTVVVYKSRRQYHEKVVYEGLKHATSDPEELLAPVFGALKRLRARVDETHALAERAHAAARCIAEGELPDAYELLRDTLVELADRLVKQKRLKPHQLTPMEKS